MSNEYKDWLHGQELEQVIFKTAQRIYDYANQVFFGKAPKDVAFRYHWGSNGAERKVLDWIWKTYIEPNEENNNEE